MARVFRNELEATAWCLMSRAIEMQAWIHNHVREQDRPVEILTRTMDAIADLSREYDRLDELDREYAGDARLWGPYPGCNGTASET